MSSVSSAIAALSCQETLMGSPVLKGAASKFQLGACPPNEPVTTMSSPVTPRTRATASRTSCSASGGPPAG